MTLWNGSFPFYPGPRAGFLFDTTRATILSVFLSLLVTFIIILPGIRGRKRLFWFLRVVLSLFVGAVVLTVQFGRDWETGWVTANASYKSFSSALVTVDVGLHIGLDGLNITLLGAPVQQLNETIDYNEFFSWGLGADYEQSYVAGLQKGLPSPILYVAEKFRARSPCGVQGQYRSAGHYASITLWMAFCSWLLALLLLSMPLPARGGCMLLLTATLLLCSLLFFSAARGAARCPIRLGTAALHTAYGASFWLALATGLLCLVLGLGIIILSSKQPEKLKVVFDLDQGRGEEEEEQGKAFLPAEASSSVQEVLLLPLAQPPQVLATKL
ncbi:dual oxidase maturation factor 1 isoform X1 [Melanerpes formicivorus]|uniref:dual oxidase maturation factor 1 isoform X1 n=1 Tax=Melanerpes formicivorus TaxID=211600 RepID=UPI00358E9547